MLRISPVESAGTCLILRLEGRVAGPWVEELCRICESSLTGHPGLRLDLTDVSYIDVGGLSVLTRLQSRGVQLMNCSPFVEEQLKATVTR